MTPPHAAAHSGMTGCSLRGSRWRQANGLTSSNLSTGCSSATGFPERCPSVPKDDVSMRSSAGPPGRRRAVDCYAIPYSAVLRRSGALSVFHYHAAVARHVGQRVGLRPRTRMRSNGLAHCSHVSISSSLVGWRFAGVDLDWS